MSCLAGQSQATGVCLVASRLNVQANLQIKPSKLTTWNHINSLRHAGSECDTDITCEPDLPFILICRPFKTTCRAFVVSSSPTRSLMFRRQIVLLFCLRTPTLSPSPPEIEPLSGSSQRPPCSLYTVTQLLDRHTSFASALSMCCKIVGIPVFKTNIVGPQLQACRSINHEHSCADLLWAGKALIEICMVVEMSGLRCSCYVVLYACRWAVHTTKQQSLCSIML